MQIQQEKDLLQALHRLLNQPPTVFKLERVPQYLNARYRICLVDGTPIVDNCFTRYDLIQATKLFRGLIQHRAKREVVFSEQQEERLRSILQKQSPNIKPLVTNNTFIAEGKKYSITRKS